MTAKRTLKRDMEPDAERVFGAALAIAWQKYHRAFNDVPHGTHDQMTALLELAGGRKALLRIAAYAAHSQAGGKRRRK